MTEQHGGRTEKDKQNKEASFLTNYSEKDCLCLSV